MAKIPKAQREFFDRFSKNILVNTLLLQLQNEGTETSPELVQKIVAVIDGAEVAALATAVREKMLELVEFKTLQKVEKFLTSPEAVQAMTAAQQVGILVQEEIYAVLRTVVSQDEETPSE